jgi:hypothetical protein
MNSLILGAMLTLSSAAAYAESCLPLGGVAVANFYAEGENQPIIISAALMGSVNNAAGKILAQRETPTGLEMDMEHYFGRTDGGAIWTKDLGVLTAVPERPGRYMIEITYEVQDERSRGTLKGYSGSFQSYGLVDLRSTDALQGLVRYSGEICK